MATFFTKKNLFFFIWLLAVVGVLISMYLSYRAYSREALSQFTHPASFEKIHIWGKPLKTLFPDITNPHYVTAETATFFLQPNDDVYYLESKTNTYVFPLFILGYHHIVNDTIDGKPLAITTCLLTNTPITYNRVVKGDELHFGVLGNLYHGNLIMYDKETDSSWIQLTGESVSGNYINKRLDMGPPLLQTKWKYLQDNKNILVLQPQMELDFYHSFVKKYQGRTTGLDLLQNVKPRNDLDSYANGVGIVIRDKTIFYPLSKIQENHVINDVIDGWHIVLFYNKTDATTHVFRRFINNKLLTFEFQNNILQDKETHSIWNYEGEAIEGKLKGTRLKSLSYRMVYWYSWSSFFPDTLIYSTSPISSTL